MPKKRKGRLYSLIAEMRIRLEKEAWERKIAEELKQKHEADLRKIEEIYGEIVEEARRKGVSEGLIHLLEGHAKNIAISAIRVWDRPYEDFEILRKNPFYPILHYLKRSLMLKAIRKQGELASALERHFRKREYIDCLTELQELEEAREHREEIKREYDGILKEKAEFFKEIGRPETKIMDEKIVEPMVAQTFILPHILAAQKYIIYKKTRQEEKAKEAFKEIRGYIEGRKIESEAAKVMREDVIRLMREHKVPLIGRV